MRHRTLPIDDSFELYKCNGASRLINIASNRRFMWWISYDWWTSYEISIMRPQLLCLMKHNKSTEWQKFVWSTYTVDINSSDSFISSVCVSLYSFDPVATAPSLFEFCWEAEKVISWRILSPSKLLYGHLALTSLGEIQFTSIRVILFNCMRVCSCIW